MLPAVMTSSRDILDTGQPAHYRYDHAMGPIYAWFTARGLRRLELPHTDHLPVRRPFLHSAANDGRVWALHAAFERYFAGMRETFDAVPLDIEDATDFQREVWLAARTIAWGVSSSYGALAAIMNRPKTSARAIGHALGQNRIAILIPCHRFLGADGKLHGFAAGLGWKKELLRLEGALLH